MQETQQKKLKKKMIKFLDLKTQYDGIKLEVDEAIKDVIQKSNFIGGSAVRQFEENFANYIGSKYCIGVGNGTDALEISIEALKLPAGSEIIVPANSYIASAEAVTRSGHDVIFADVDSNSYVISIEDLKKKITSKTKAIIAVHLYGHPCNMEELKEIALKYNLFIIEDAAQAHGSEFNGIKVGKIGDISAFSFYPGKNLGAYGDGGAITTDDFNLAELCKKISNHGRITKYDHEFVGRNSRLDSIQASILNVKLKHLDKWNNKRIEVANKYLSKLKGVGDIILPQRQIWAKQAYHLFVIRTKKRDKLKNYLLEKGIETGIHYPISLPKQKAYYYKNKFKENLFSNLSDTTLLSLPIGEHLTNMDVDYIVDTIKVFFGR
jgi:dTDP-4-amino-4,6-dideoxygalactose transaminase